MTNNVNYTGKRKLLTFIAALLAGLTIFTASVFAYPEHTDYISDSATVLDETCETSVKAASDTLYQTKGCRVAVCTIDTTGTEEISAYAANLFKEWEIGSGVLLLIVTTDDTYYAVQSSDISDVLTNSVLSELLNTNLEASFAAKEYSAGVSATVTAVANYLKTNLPADFKASETKSGGGMPTALKVILILILIVVILGGIGYLVLLWLEKRQAERRRAYREAQRQRLARGGAPVRSYHPGQAPRNQAPRNQAPRNQAPQRRAPSQQRPDNYDYPQDSYNDGYYDQADMFNSNIVSDDQSGSDGYNESYAATRKFDKSEIRRYTNNQRHNR